MQEYGNKQMLINEIQKRADLFINEFNDIPNDKGDVRLDGIDKTPKEMIAYQLGWLNLVMGWEKDELDGKEVITPTQDYKWNKLGKLYQSFFRTYNKHLLSELCQMFKETVNEFIQWLSTVDDNTLFQAGVRKWTVTSANWPMWKWVHINTVAPFKNFRTQVRKWKKINIS